MGWAVLVVLIIIAAFAIPRFGTALLALLGVVVIGVVILGVVLYQMDQQDKRERELATSRISRSEIELVDLALQPGYGTSSYTLVGRVRNLSAQYTLSEVRLKLVMRDCAPAGHCEIVGETDESLYLGVPPGQARDLNEYVSFRGLGPPSGKHQWEHQILEIIGR